MSDLLKRIYFGIGIFLAAVAIALAAAWLTENRSLNTNVLSSIDRIVSEVPASTTTATDRMMSAARERIRKNPYDATGYVRLASACLQNVRETGDPAMYAKAEVLLERALEFDPNNVEAMTGMGSLLLSRHQFQAALKWGKRARVLDPYGASAYGIMGDAYIELGKYDEAVKAIQLMVNTRPDMRSYSRVSYVREMYGDQEGAIAAMLKALNATPLNTEQGKWCAVQLGNLYFNNGKITEAEKMYHHAIGEPPYAFAIAGLAKVRAAQKRYIDAILLYEQAIALLPEHAFVEALGDVYLAAGKPDEAEKQFSLVRKMLQSDQENGMNIDLELALFEADHGQNIDEAAQRAHREYEGRPQSIKAADALAWALCKAGRFEEAFPYSQQALRLGTKDAQLLFHAGYIAYRLGRKEEAHEYLTKALAVNPHFSLRYFEEARKLLEQLNGKLTFPTIASTKQLVN